MKKRILIVDDDIMTLKLLKKNLEETYDVVTENAGYRFVEKMETYEADLILLDIEMPVVNGIQAFEEVLKNPEMSDVPVVFLSGVANPNLVRELIAKGAAGYLVKTVPKEEIAEKIEQVLAQKVTSREVPEVLILDSDAGNLKKMRDDLVSNNYRVRAVRSMMDAAGYIKNHHPKLFVIGRDISGVSPHEVYESLEHFIRDEHVIPLVMEESFFSAELIDRVRKALGD